MSAEPGITECLEPGTLTVLQRLAMPLRAVALGYQATAVGEHTPRPELGFLMLQAWSLVFSGSP